MDAKVIDADGHILEPPDLWERYVESRWRSRAIRVKRGDDGRDFLEIDGRPARLTTPEMLGGFGGMGKSFDDMAAACLSGRYAENAPRPATDPAARVELLDRDGIAAALLYPSLGLQWEGEVDDAEYALAQSRAYNRWIEDFCRDSRGRLAPIAHLTLGDPDAAAAELRRAVKNGARGGFLLPFTLDGLPHGHPAHDALYAAAEDLDVPIALHTGIDPPARSLHHRYDGLTWPEGVMQGIWYLQMMFPQAVQQAFSTFFLHATFDRFPRLKLVVLESGASWLGFWVDRMDALYKSPLRVTMTLGRPPSEYVRRQCWISADPDERALPPVIDYIGADRFLWATDYPHSDHGANYMEELGELAGNLPSEVGRRLVGGNAMELYGL
jgi:predicted TIM-barrel fold metal-dependent hydrolase